MKAVIKNIQSREPSADKPFEITKTEIDQNIKVKQKDFKKADPNKN